MKDQQAIKKLELLKTIQPTKNTLKNIKESVYLQVKPESRVQPYFRFSNISTILKSYRIAFYAGIGLLLITFLFASALLFPSQTHIALLYGKLAFESNQYKKARIAFEDTKSRFGDNNTIQLKNTKDLAYSLTLTNTQLNGLKLKGEKGKYTAQQCHQIYQEYLTYLESKEKIIPSHNISLTLEFNSYEEQAEKKLQMYKSL